VPRGEFVPLEVPYPHIEKADGDVARLKRHPRIRVAQLVMDYLAHGWSADEMCRQHAFLTPSEVHAALGYYFDHQQEIDAEIRSEVDDAEKSRTTSPPSPFLARLRSGGSL
jgi:uncharacterized protein (DUF433 family)